jgi:tetratricopeptide (TPR) repeat protein
MRRIALVAFTTLVWLSISLTSTADDRVVAAHDSISEGIAAYERAQAAVERDTRNREFRRAAALFQQAATATASADLWTNVGNADLQAQSLGGAILAYKRALALDPDHLRARQNLDHARSMLPAWVPKPEESGVLQSFFFWHRTLARGERETLAAVSFALAAMVAGLALALRRVGLRALAIPPALVFAAMASSLVFEAAEDHARSAVVVVDETLVRASDSINAELRFSTPLPAGTEFSVLETRAGFTRVRLANGREGWVAASSYETVGP